MPGRGRTPKPQEQRHGAHDPQRGEWRAPEEPGWQFGEIPTPPRGLMPEAENAWNVWFRAWFAAFWTPDELPGLRQVIRLYDQVERGEFQRSAELRLEMDTYGMTPKGQQDRRWMRPKTEQAAEGKILEGRWADLKVVDAVPPTG